ncbi:hypothetical protein SAMN05216304_109184 [Bosea sp. OK403]|jgi:hypothetical protein|nr:MULTISPECIES: hypothetical protein [Bosea]WNJ88418.1 hypothetical protein RMR04_18595 [Bosea sp. 685]SFJ55899.1 hypothetical protein SAMN05216304_109184 [Bosea sp. OK403]
MNRADTPKIRPAGALSVAMKLVMLAMVMPRVLRFKLRRGR